MTNLEAWLILREDEKKTLTESRRIFRDLARSKGWKIQERFSGPQNVNVSPSGREIRRELLKGRDAYDLYRRLHKARVLVITSHCILLSVKPGASSHRYLVSLDEFVKYKAILRECQAIPTTAEFFDGAVRELESITADDLDDPRSLPLHLMSPQIPTGLGTGAGRRAFNSQSGSPGERSCDGWRWKRDRHAQHGREQLTIGSTRLEAGAHWDVSQVKRGSRREFPAVIKTWLIERKGYINVYPDGFIRQGKLCRTKK